MPNTIRFHRVLRAPPERVYRAFVDPDAMVKWLPPNGYTGKVHRAETRVGGGYAMSFTNLGSGTSHSWQGVYRELTEPERIQYTATFDDPLMRGEMVTTITLTRVSVGTELVAEQSGIPDMIPPELCYLGWQESLVLLAKLVEAEIPG
jgi:uncharacterized protein YndB with AHSA1/START domain